VLLLDLFVCLVLFVIWLWVCSGFQCMAYWINQWFKNEEKMETFFFLLCLFVLSLKGFLVSV
jgi:hypothetical protein